jgi:hypothetical protein
MPLKVVAIVSAYNEADVIEQTTRDLIDQGVHVYLLDHHSTDGTADLVRPLLGRGVLAIERFPADCASRFELRGILARKEELSASLDADWLINHDADELREAPWPGATLVEALEVVDCLGWNAVDFAVLNFQPTTDEYQPGDDLRLSFPYYEGPQSFDKLQIRCWKKQPRVDLVSTGGHEARFDGRSVFPLRFLLRHYPIRGQRHGERKIFIDRRPRFDEAERGIGWHVQYSGVAPGHRFLRDPSALIRFDPTATRIDALIHHRGVEEAESHRRAAERAAEVANRRLDCAIAEVKQHEREAARLQGEIARIGDLLDRTQREMSAAQDRVASLQDRIASLHASWSWRITAPLRRAYELLRR